METEKGGGKGYTEPQMGQVMAGSKVVRGRGVEAFSFWGVGISGEAAGGRWAEGVRVQQGWLWGKKVAGGGCGWREWGHDWDGGLWGSP